VKQIESILKQISEAETSQEERFKIHLKGAESGIASSQYELAKCYYFGRGVPKDIEKAVKWFLQSAIGEHADAQYFMACHYFDNGKHSDAVKWLQKAADKGHEKAKQDLIELSKNEED